MLFRKSPKWKATKTESELNELARFLDIAIKLESEVRLDLKRVKLIRELIKKEQARQTKYNHGCYYCPVCGSEVSKDDEQCPYCRRNFVRRCK